MEMLEDKRMELMTGVSLANMEQESVKETSFKPAPLNFIPTIFMLKFFLSSSALKHHQVTGLLKERSVQPNMD